ARRGARSAAPSAAGAVPARRGRNGVPLLPQASPQARRLAALILEVWAGLRTPLQAAQVLGLSLPRYYQIEANGLAGLVAGCAPKPRGRQASAAPAATALRRDNERLRRGPGPDAGPAGAAPRRPGGRPPPPPPTSPPPT